MASPDTSLCCLAPADPEREERQHSEHRINKILSEVNKSGEKFPGLAGESHHAHHPALLLPNNTEELKLAALSFYQSELSQLQKLPGGIIHGGDQSEEEHQPEPEDSDKDSVKEEKENQEHKEADSLKGSGPFSLLGAKSDHSFGQVRPSLPHSQVGGRDGGLSSREKIFLNLQAMFGFGPSLENPLQRMASITNSLVSQPLPSPHFSQQKLKAVLPPITQQQVAAVNVCLYLLDSHSDTPDPH